MELKGTKTKYEGNAMMVALKNSGYRLREKKVSWPRKIGQGIVLVDCSRLPCRNALFLR